MKKCPYCAEEIQDAAIKCRYCGEMLDRLPPQVGWPRLEQPPRIPFSSTLANTDIDPCEDPRKAKGSYVKRLKPAKDQDTALGCMGCLVIFVAIFGFILYAAGNKSDRKQDTQKSLEVAEKKARQDTHVREMIKSALAELDQGRFSEAEEAFSELNSYKEANLYGIALSLRRDCRRLNNEEYIGRVLADMSDADFKKLMESDPLVAPPLYREKELNNALAFVLNERVGSLDGLREREMARREAERQQLAMAEAKRKDAARQKAIAQPPENSVFARRVDNIRSGPGTRHGIVRETSTYENLPFERKEGQWYKLASGTQAEWVHESVVMGRDDYLEHKLGKLFIYIPDNDTAPLLKEPAFSEETTELLTVPGGTELEVLEVKDMRKGAALIGFYKVAHKGQTGWINQYFTTEESVTCTPEGGKTEPMPGHDGPRMVGFSEEKMEAIAEQSAA